MSSAVVSGEESRPSAEWAAEGAQVPAIGDARRYFSALLAGELVNKLARFLAALLLARALTAHEFGIFNVGIAFAGILYTATTLGLTEIAGRRVAIAPEEAPTVSG